MRGAIAVVTVATAATAGVEKCEAFHFFNGGFRGAYSSSSSSSPSSPSSWSSSGLSFPSSGGWQHVAPCHLARGRFGVGAPIEDRDNTHSDPDEILVSRLDRVFGLHHQGHSSA